MPDLNFFARSPASAQPTGHLTGKTGCLAFRNCLGPFKPNPIIPVIICPIINYFCNPHIKDNVASYSSFCY
jgi:hypothetical protein